MNPIFITSMYIIASFHVEIAIEIIKMKSFWYEVLFLDLQS